MVMLGAAVSLPVAYLLLMPMLSWPSNGVKNVSVMPAPLPLGGNGAYTPVGQAISGSLIAGFSTTPEDA